MKHLVATAVGRSVVDGDYGRSGASIERLHLSDGARVVVKRTNPRVDFAMRLSRDECGRELRLWRDGILDRLPISVGHAILDGWRDGEDIVTVMDDLTGAVIDWDTRLNLGCCQRIFSAVAAMHATFLDESIRALCPLATRLAMFAPQEVRTATDHPMARAVLRGWERFFELAPVDVAAEIRSVHDDPAGLAERLLARSATLAHGDLWLVNMARSRDGVVLLDWSLATAAPGAFDFATFMMGASGLDIGADDLLGCVRTAQARDYDDTALRLSLLAAVVDLGWNKALDAAEHPDAAIRERERRNLGWWIDQVRRAMDLRDQR